MELTKIFDQYNLFARVYPILLLLLPSLLTIVAFRPEFLNSSPISIVISIAIFSGFLYLLANVSRTLGKDLEKRLLKTWDGLPTTALLRHRNLKISITTKRRYHRYLGTHVPGLGRLPTELQEQQDPKAADEIYASAIMWLKEQRRDGKLYPIVIKEVTEYGFRRNLASLKWIGVIIYIAGIILCTYALGVQHEELVRKYDSCSAIGQTLLSSPNIFGSGLLNVLALFCAFLLNDDWVKEAGQTYAYSLLATCDA